MIKKPFSNIFIFATIAAVVLIGSSLWYWQVERDKAEKNLEQAINRSIDGVKRTGVMIGNGKKCDGVKIGNAAEFNASLTLPLYKLQLYKAKPDENLLRLYRDSSELYPYFVNVNCMAVYRGNSNEPIQVLPVEGSSFSLLDYENSDSFIEAVDLSFDGYNDVEMLIDQGNQNPGYLVWIFDPKISGFVFHNELRGGVIYADSKRRVVHVTFSGMSPAFYDYIFENDKFVLVRESTVNWVPTSDKYERVVKERRNGVMIEISREITN